MKQAILTALCAMALVACGPNPEYKPPTDQSVQQSHSDSGSTMSNMLLGGMFGYMMGSSGNKSAPQTANIYQAPSVSPAPQVAPQSRAFVPKPTPAPVPPVKAAVAPPPAPAPAPAPRPMAQPAPKPSYAGPSGYSSVRQSAPTYSAPSRSISVGRR